MGITMINQHKIWFKVIKPLGFCQNKKPGAFSWPEYMELPQRKQHQQKMNVQKK
jgi:hypothetical protein